MKHGEEIGDGQESGENGVAGLPKIQFVRIHETALGNKGPDTREDDEGRNDVEGQIGRSNKK